MKPLVRLLAGCVLGWVVGLFTAAATPTRAEILRYPGTGCIPIGEQEEYTRFAGGLSTDNAEMAVTCPFVTGSILRHTSVASLTVRVYDATNPGIVRASACVRAYDTTSYVCGTTDASTDGMIGYDSLTPSLSVWNNSNYFYWSPYVFVELFNTGSAIRYVDTSS